MIGAGTGRDESAPSTIARSLSLSSEVGLSERSRSALPLHLAVDDFMASQSILGLAEKQQLWHCTHKILSEHLFPRLRLKQASHASSTMCIIRFAHEILEADIGHIFRIDGINNEISLATLRDATRGLVVSLRSSLESHAVDDSVVSAIISCTRALAVSRLASDQFQGRTCNDSSVAEWSKECSRSIWNLNDEDTSSDVITASYVWHSLLWIKSVAEMLVDRSGQRADKLPEFLTMLADEERWPLTTPQEEDFLRDLTTHLFTKKERASTAVNIYAKQKKADGHDRKADPWSPNADVNRAAKHFLIEMIPLCYT